MPPVLERACKIATEAAEECRIAVSTAPTAIPRKGLVNAVRIWANSGVSASGAMESRIMTVPYIRMAKPTRIVPVLRILPSLYLVRRTMPIKAARGENASGLSSWSQMASLSMPDRDKIQAVRVVPMLEPIITPMVCPSSMMPELTRPTSMTVTAVEDWMAMVMPAPRTNALKRLEVIFLSSCSNFPPASPAGRTVWTCRTERRRCRRRG